MSFDLTVRCAPRPLLAGAAACLGLAAAVSHAQSDPPAAQSVIVSAARQPQALADALLHTTVLTRRDIERSQAVDLPSLLAGEAGVQFASNGGRGSATTLFLRGSPSLQVLVLVDGVPLAKQDATGALSIEHLMLDQIERVEVVRGNVSALYGSGAIGGVIQLFTRRAGSSPSGWVAAEAGSQRFGRLAGGAAAQFGATRVAVGLSRISSQGFSAIDTTAIPAANPDRDGYGNLNGSLNIDHEWRAGHKLALSLARSDGRLDYDSAFSAPTDVQSSRTRVRHARLASDDQLTPTWHSQFSYSEQVDDLRDHQTGAFGYDARYATRVRSASWLNRIQLDGWNLHAGLEHQRQSIDAEDGFGGAYARQRNLNALLAGAQGALGAHALQLALRHDDSAGQPAQTHGLLAWGWTFMPAWKLTASASTAFNLPPLGYLYAPFFGNPALKPERARSAEVGLQYANQRQVMRVTAFDSRVRDELQYDFATNTFGNVARTRNRGVEMSYDGRVGGADLRASLTSQDPIDELTGQRRLRRAATLASLALSQPVGPLRVGAVARHAGERVDSGNVPLAAYTVVDLNADWTAAPGVQVFGRVENATDRRYQTVNGYNQPPRGLFVGVRLSRN